MPFHQNFQCLLLSLALMIDIGHSESDMFCQPGNSWIYFTESDNIEKNITSPGYPASTYSTSSSNCDISIEITFPQTAVLYVENHGVVSAGCTTDYQFLDRSVTSLPTYHNCTQLHDGNTSQLIHVLLGNYVDSRFHVVIRLPLLMVERNRFNLTLYVLPLYAMRSNGKSYTKSLYSAPTGYISSHDRFSTHYGTDLKNFLRFATIPSNATEVVFDFVYLNIGNGRSRSGCNPTQVDIFRICRTRPDGSQHQLHEICDAESPPDSIIVNLTQFPATSLLLEFLTNSREAFNGFLLKYYVVLQTTAMPKSSPTTTSSTTAVATSTRPTNVTEFFEVRINVIAVAAGGGGGLILIIIIIVLCCVICRRNQTRRKAEEPHANAVELESRFPRLTSASQKDRSDTNVGNEYSSGQLDMPVHHVDVGDSTYYSEVDIMPTSSQEADKRNHNGKSVEPPTIGKPGDRKFRSLDVYTPIDPKTKKEKVEMFDNDLYASRDSYNSDQSSGSENEE